MMTMDRCTNPCGARKYQSSSADRGYHYLTSKLRREPSDDSPSLKWSNIQKKMELHTSEVILLLDCCYAAQAARDYQARRRSPIPPNVELFAACGMGEKTVRPGPWSFTSLLIAEFRKQLDESKFVIVATAHKNMASKQSQLGQSAVYFPLDKKKSTMRLEPIRRHEMPRAEPATDSASLTLQLSMRDNDQEAIREVVEWLKLNPPRSISGIVVENIITSATVACQYVSDQKRGYQSITSFEALPEPGKMDIWATWNAFISTVTGLARSVAELNMSPASPTLLAKDDMSGNIVQKLDEGLQPLQSAIERSVMTLPELNDEGTLLKAIDNKIVQDLGFADMLKLRLVARFDERLEPDQHLQAQMGDNTLKREGSFSSLSIEDVAPLGRVLVECRLYSNTGAQNERLALESSKRSMQKLVQLLSSSKSSDFHSLICIRYFHEPDKSRYGLIFQLPQGSRRLQITLRDAINKITGKYKPTLGQRFDMARKIGKAILKWHLVGWVHQGIASHNIVFFYDEDHGVDYSRPYLCGFEYSRESAAPSTGRFVQDFELNVYRHPDRQGIPSKYHRKDHDIYAYGILLLEIGLWKLVGKLFDDGEKKSISPYQMGQRILQTAQERLAHSMDSSYQVAAVTCLSGEFGANQDDAEQSLLAAAFDAQVLTRIERGVGVSRY